MAKRTGGGATRKIKWLAGVVVGLVVAYSALWLFLANRLETEADQVIAQAAANGTIIECVGRDAGGYPFRLGLFCEETGLEANGTVVNAGAFRSAAQIYRPGLVISEIEGPLTVQGAGTTVEAQWDRARASTRFGTEQLNLGTVDLTDLSIAANLPNGTPVTADVARILASVQPSGTDLDLALTVDGADPAPVAGRDVPPMDLFIDATVSDAAGAVSYDNQALDSLRGRSVQLRDLNLAFVDGGRIEAGGDLDIDADGLATGTLDIGFSDLSATIAGLTNLFPEAASQLDAIRSVVGGGGDGGAGGLLAGILGGGRSEEQPAAETTDAENASDLDTNVSITVDRGRMRLGVIPIGSFPILP